MKHRPGRRGKFQITTLLAVVALLVIVFLTSAYFVFTSPPSVSEAHAQAIAELRRQKETWESARPAAFRYVVERDCICPNTFTMPYDAVEGRGSKTARFPDLTLARFDDDTAVPDDPVWIGDVFDLVEAALGRGDQITVRYDSRFGYPNDVDKIATTDREKYRLFIRDFEVLEYD